jgi:transcriptional regulator with XRE-family HTH domain
MTTKSADEEVGRVLEHLRETMRQAGWSQLDVQEELDWGRSYISQLMTRQKMLRVEQVLMILDVIGVSPADFYRELYDRPWDDDDEL